MFKFTPGDIVYHWSDTNGEDPCVVVECNGYFTQVKFLDNGSDAVFETSDVATSYINQPI